MKPAALNALLAGDHANFIAASTPGGIEAQERAGQIRESFNETLPQEMIGCSRDDFERLGFKFLHKTDKIFWQCEFPVGWRKKATEHSMWSELLDDKGRKRGMIFFKAAFYDYNAHVGLECRYQIKCDYGNKQSRYFVLDAATGETLLDTPATDRPCWSDRPEAERRYQASQRQEALCREWLDQHFQDWKSPLAYWNDPVERIGPKGV